MSDNNSRRNLTREMSGPGNILPSDSEEDEGKNKRKSDWFKHINQTNSSKRNIYFEKSNILGPEKSLMYQTIFAEKIDNVLGTEQIDYEKITQTHNEELNKDFSDTEVQSDILERQPTGKKSQLFRRKKRSQNIYGNVVDDVLDKGSEASAFSEPANVRPFVEERYSNDSEILQTKQTRRNIFNRKKTDTEHKYSELRDSKETPDNVQSDQNQEKILPQVKKGRELFGRRTEIKKRGYSDVFNEISLKKTKSADNSPESDRSNADSLHSFTNSILSSTRINPKNNSPLRKRASIYQLALSPGRTRRQSRLAEIPKKVIEEQNSSLETTLPPSPSPEPTQKDTIAEKYPSFDDDHVLETVGQRKAVFNRQKLQTVEIPQPIKQTDTQNVENVQNKIVIEDENVQSSILNVSPEEKIILHQPDIIVKYKKVQVLPDNENLNENKSDNEVIPDSQNDQQVSKTRRRTISKSSSTQVVVMETVVIDSDKENELEQENNTINLAAKLSSKNITEKSAANVSRNNIDEKEQDIMKKSTRKRLDSEKASKLKEDIDQQTTRSRKISTVNEINEDKSANLSQKVIESNVEVDQIEKDESLTNIKSSRSDINTSRSRRSPNKYPERQISTSENVEQNKSSLNTENQEPTRYSTKNTPNKSKSLASSSRIVEEVPENQEMLHQSTRSRYSTRSSPNKYQERAKSVTKVIEIEENEQNLITPTKTASQEFLHESARKYSTRNSPRTRTSEIVEQNEIEPSRKSRNLDISTRSRYSTRSSPNKYQERSSSVSRITELENLKQTPRKSRKTSSQEFLHESLRRYSSRNTPNKFTGRVNTSKRIEDELSPSRNRDILHESSRSRSFNRNSPTRFSKRNKNASVIAEEDEINQSQTTPRKNKSIKENLDDNQSPKRTSSRNSQKSIGVVSPTENQIQRKSQRLSKSPKKLDMDTEENVKGTQDEQQINISTKRIRTNSQKSSEIEPSTENQTGQRKNQRSPKNSPKKNSTNKDMENEEQILLEDKESQPSIKSISPVVTRTGLFGRRQENKRNYSDLLDDLSLDKSKTESVNIVTNISTKNTEMQELEPITNRISTYRTEKMDRANSRLTQEIKEKPNRQEAKTRNENLINDSPRNSITLKPDDTNDTQDELQLRKMSLRNSKILEIEPDQLSEENFTLTIDDDEQSVSESNKSDHENIPVSTNNSQTLIIKPPDQFDDEIEDDVFHRSRNSRQISMRKSSRINITEPIDVMIDNQVDNDDKFERSRNSKMRSSSRITKTDDNHQENVDYDDQLEKFRISRHMSLRNSSRLIANDANDELEQTDDDKLQRSRNSRQVSMRKSSRLTGTDHNDSQEEDTTSMQKSRSSRQISMRKSSRITDIEEDQESLGGNNERLEKSRNSKQISMRKNSRLPEIEEISSDNEKQPEYNKKLEKSRNSKQISMRKSSRLTEVEEIRPDNERQSDLDGYNERLEKSRNSKQISMRKSSRLTETEEIGFDNERQLDEDEYNKRLEKSRNSKQISMRKSSRLTEVEEMGSDNGRQPNLDGFNERLEKSRNSKQISLRKSSRSTEMEENVSDNEEQPLVRNIDKSRNSKQILTRNNSILSGIQEIDPDTEKLETSQNNKQSSMRKSSRLTEVEEIGFDTEKLEKSRSSKQTFMRKSSKLPETGSNIEEQEIDKIENLQKSRTSKQISMRKSSRPEKESDTDNEEQQDLVRNKEKLEKSRNSKQISTRKSSRLPEKEYGSENEEQVLDGNKLEKSRNSKQISMRKSSRLPEKEETDSENDEQQELDRNKEKLEKSRNSKQISMRKSSRPEKEYYSENEEQVLGGNKIEKSRNSKQISMRKSSRPKKEESDSENDEQQDLGRNKEKLEKSRNSKQISMRKSSRPKKEESDSENDEQQDLGRNKEKLEKSRNSKQISIRKSSRPEKEYDSENEEQQVLGGSKLEKSRNSKQISMRKSSRPEKEYDSENEEQVLGGNKLEKSRNSRQILTRKSPRKTSIVDIDTIITNEQELIDNNEKLQRSQNSKQISMRRSRITEIEDTEKLEKSRNSKKISMRKSSRIPDAEEYGSDNEDQEFNDKIHKSRHQNSIRKSSRLSQIEETDFDNNEQQNLSGNKEKLETSRNIKQTSMRKSVRNREIDSDNDNEEILIDNNENLQSSRSSKQVSKSSRKTDYSDRDEQVLIENNEKLNKSKNSKKISMRKSRITESEQDFADDNEIFQSRNRKTSLRTSSRATEIEDIISTDNQKDLSDNVYENLQKSRNSRQISMKMISKDNQESIDNEEIPKSKKDLKRSTIVEVHEMNDDNHDQEKQNDLHISRKVSMRKSSEFTEGQDRDDQELIESQKLQKSRSKTISPKKSSRITHVHEEESSDDPEEIVRKEVHNSNRSKRLSKTSKSLRKTPKSLYKPNRSQISVKNVLKTARRSELTPVIQTSNKIGLGTFDSHRSTRSRKINPKEKLKVDLFKNLELEASQRSLSVENIDSQHQSLNRSRKTTENDNTSKQNLSQMSKNTSINSKTITPDKSSTKNNQNISQRSSRSRKISENDIIQTKDNISTKRNSTEDNIISNKRRTVSPNTIVKQNESHISTGSRKSGLENPNSMQIEITETEEIFNQAKRQKITDSARKSTSTSTLPNFEEKRSEMSRKMSVNSNSLRKMVLDKKEISRQNSSKETQTSLNFYNREIEIDVESNKDESIHSNYSDHQNLSINNYTGNQEDMEQQNSSNAKNLSRRTAISIETSSDEEEFQALIRKSNKNMTQMTVKNISVDQPLYQSIKDINRTSKIMSINKNSNEMDLTKNTTRKTIMESKRQTQFSNLDSEVFEHQSQEMDSNKSVGGNKLSKAQLLANIEEISENKVRKVGFELNKKLLEDVKKNVTVLEESVVKPTLKTQKIDQFFPKLDKKSWVLPKKKVAQPVPKYKVLSNGECLPKPKLHKSEKWMSPTFYKHIEKVLLPKHGLRNTVEAEKIMILLGETCRKVKKSKKYLQKEVEYLKYMLAKAGLIKNMWDFQRFVMKWLPFELCDNMLPSYVGKKGPTSKIFVPFIQEEVSIPIVQLWEEKYSKL